jgi:hypothetical protein
MRVAVLALGAAVIGGLVVGACGGESDTTFGPPNGLVNQRPPAPGTATGSSSGSSSGGSSGSSSGSSSGGSSGASSSGGSSGSSSGGADGGSSGGTDGGTTTQSCTVSWKTQVFPLFESTGGGTCGTSACHGGASAPTILDNDPATTYTNLSKYSINGKTLIVPADTNPADGTLECNLGMVTPVCGLQQMPQPPGALNSAQRTTIDTWVRCGAPNN